MHILEEISTCIKNRQIEKSYELIINNEDKYVTNHKYWNLRAELCLEINECETAINCYLESIKLDELNAKTYLGIAKTYYIMGEKLKSLLYAGLCMRNTDNEETLKKLESIYSNEEQIDLYKDMMHHIYENTNMNAKNLNLPTYISTYFNNISIEFIEVLEYRGICKNWAFIKDGYVVTNNDIFTIDKLLENQIKYGLQIIIPYDDEYVYVTREIAKKGIEECIILLENKCTFKTIHIDKETMKMIAKEQFKRTIALNRFNEADSNIDALIKLIPNKYKKEYILDVIEGRDVYDIDNMVKVPLISSVTVSGFNTFCGYPKFTYNIDVGHGSVGFKSCGNMDKKNKKFAFTPEDYKNIDKICITSTMNMMMLSSFTGTTEDKYIITGNPRTDTLLISDGRTNLEKILGRKIGSKKIIFNMPTFNKHENTNILNGMEGLDDSIKIKGFDYERFDAFLEKNNMICISKVHHAEQNTVSNKTKYRKLDNMIFISNEDLGNHNIDLYEILNCGDILITDYSSIYGDFLFMDRPIVFLNSDIDIYREERGIILEPYDFWTAGPKVVNQNELELEIIKSLDIEYYGQKRRELRDVFYKYKDSKSSLRVWEYIDSILSKKDSVRVV